MSENALIDKLIYENEDKFYQYRAVVSEFRDVQYLHLRKYFQSFEGEYIPSKEGASIPVTIDNIYALLEVLVELCSKTELQQLVLKHLKSDLEPEPKSQ